MGNSRRLLSNYLQRDKSLACAKKRNERARSQGRISTIVSLSLRGRGEDAHLGRTASRGQGSPDLRTLSTGRKIGVYTHREGTLPTGCAEPNAARSSALG